MRTNDVLRSWGMLLRGKKPALSIEITKECPLRCPGCYAYGADHLGGGSGLRQLSDFRGDELVRKFLALVDKHKPIHVSIVGGDPLVRYRELTQILPELDRRGIHVQVVTSAFRPLPPEWARLTLLYIAVSIDGLAPEHDKRRAPATYERILKNIQGHAITVHCTLTSQMLRRPGYLNEFLEFWQNVPEARRVWISMYTPQMGESSEEVLTPVQRSQAVSELLELRHSHSKLEMNDAVLRAFLSPPHAPSECIFAQTTHSVSADLATVIGPCQFGGTPDCSQCGCLASMGLEALGRHRIAGGIEVRSLFRMTQKLARLRSSRRPVETATKEVFPILNSQSAGSRTKEVETASG